MNSIVDIFAACAELPAPERLTYLRRIVDDNTQLYDEVLSLLAAHDEASSNFLAKPAFESTVAARRSLHANTFRDLPAGYTIDDFVIIKELGRGTYATVYLASQLSLGRNVAIKLSRFSSDEARTQAGLQHPNIVQVHTLTALPDGQGSLICMRYVPGVTLQALLDWMRAERAAGRAWDGKTMLAQVDAAVDGTQVYGIVNEATRARVARMTAQQLVTHIAQALVEALAFAHSKGILHLDVKPANVMIDVSGGVFLTDFNVSVIAAREEQQTLGGTFRYMAPEHQRAFRDDDPAGVDHRADIYSFGVVLGELLDLLPEGSPELDALQDHCVKANHMERPDDAAQVATLCANQGWTRDLRTALDCGENWFLYRYATRTCVMALVLAAFVPNVVASALQSGYNHIHIVGALTAAQRELFTAIVLPLSFVVYGVGAWVLYHYYAPVLACRWWKRRAYLTPLERDRTRRLLLVNHLRAMSFIALAWTFVGAVIMLSLHYLAGPLPSGVIVHFVVSFALALMVALTYSFLPLYYLNVVVHYPHYLHGIVDLHGTIAKETKERPGVLRFFRFAAIATPLLGATIIVVQGPSPLQSYEVFEFLILAFLASTMAGFIFTEALVDKTQRGLSLLHSGKNTFQ